MINKKKTTERPHFESGMHPLELGKYYVVTPSIFRLLKLLCKWIRGMRPGCVVYGYSRIGKTQAIMALGDKLPQEFQGLPVFKHSMLEHQKPTEKEFFRNILASFQHARADYGNAGVKRDVLVDFLTEQANNTPQKRVVVFFDEAQWIRDIEYGYLRGVYNSLMDRQIAPMFVLVGDTNLYKKYDAYKQAENREITGRFMSETFRFTGIKSVEEAKLVLNGYDITDAPHCSGWYFTRYYFPAAFDAGWRLSSQALSLWSTYCEITKEKKKYTPEIFMCDLAPAVQYFLTQFSDLERVSPIFVPKCWREAFQFVGISS